MKDAKLYHRLSPHQPLLQQRKCLTVCLKTDGYGERLSFTYRQPLSLTAQTAPPLQTKIFALNQGEEKKKSFHNLSVSEDMPSWKPTKKSQKQDYNFYIHCLH